MVMWEEKSSHDWRRTGGILAMLHNVNRANDSVPLKAPDDYNPHALAERERAEAAGGAAAAAEAAEGPREVGIGALIAAWTRPGGGNGRG